MDHWHDVIVSVWTPLASAEQVRAWGINVIVSLRLPNFGGKIVNPSSKDHVLKHIKHTIGIKFKSNKNTY